MKNAEGHVGIRLVDVLDVHFYPADTVQVDVNRDGAKEELRVHEEYTAAQLGNSILERMSTFFRLMKKRENAPRALWDESYDEKTWIQDTNGDQPTRLLPLLKDTIAEYYPNTKLALTEYYFGGRKDMSGAIAQADVLGILSRYEIFAASLWEYGVKKPSEQEPDPYSYIYAAFAMYRNYDGVGGRFGPQSIPASSSNQDIASIHASNGGAEHRIVAVALNREFDDKQVALKIQSCRCYTSYSIYLLAGSPPVPVLANDLIIQAKLNALSFRLPSQSVVTIVAHRKTPTWKDVFYACGPVAGPAVGHIDRPAQEAGASSRR